MYTKEIFHALKPDLLINFIPLGYPPPRTTILATIVEVIAKEYPDLLIDGEHGTIAVNTRKHVMP